jgi:RNA recognition motif-containing protein
LGKRFIKVEAPMTPRALSAATDRGGDEGRDRGAEGKTAAGRGEKIVQPPGCRTVFVKNIPYDCSEDALLEAFKLYGKISNVRIARWNHTNQSKGFGYVEFTSENSANIAVRKSGDVVLSGRVTLCDFDTGRVKGSFRGPPSAAAAAATVGERGFKKRKTVEQS